MRPTVWALLPAAALIAPAPAFAMRYLSVEQAQRLLFPTASTFTAQTVQLTPAAWSAIDRDEPAPVARREPAVWSVTSGEQTLGHLYVDEVLGKQLYITYAVALDRAGKVLGVEILEYRESHGEEVRNARWRAQFTGKNGSDAITLGRDIKNISGATLSSRHVTQGVKRLLAIHAARRN